MIRKGKCKDKKKGRREDVGRERKKKAMKKVQMANEDVVEGKEGKLDEGDGCGRKTETERRKWKKWSNGMKKENRKEQGQKERTIRHE